MHFNHLLQPAASASAVPSLKKAHSRRTSANTKKKTARPSPAGNLRPPGATASAGSSTTASVCHTARASCALGAADLKSPGSGGRQLLGKPHHERVRSLCSMNVAEAIEKAPTSRKAKQSARQSAPVEPIPENATFCSGHSSRFGNNLSKTVVVPEGVNEDPAVSMLKEDVKRGGQRKKSDDHEELILEEQDFVPEDFFKNQFTTRTAPRKIQPQIVYQGEA